MLKRFVKFLNPTGEKFDLSTIFLYAIAVIALLALFLWIDNLLPSDWIYIPLDLK